LQPLYGCVNPLSLLSLCACEAVPSFFISCPLTSPDVVAPQPGWLCDWQCRCPGAYQPNSPAGLRCNPSTSPIPSLSLPLAFSLAVLAHSLFHRASVTLSLCRPHPPSLPGSLLGKPASRKLASRPPTCQPISTDRSSFICRNHSISLSLCMPS